MQSGINLIKETFRFVLFDFFQIVLFPFFFFCLNSMFTFYMSFFQIEFDKLHSFQIAFWRSHTYHQKKVFVLV